MNIRLGDTFVSGLAPSITAVKCHFTFVRLTSPLCSCIIFNNFVAGAGSDLMSTGRMFPPKLVDGIIMSISYV
jgi:hypothetical protein